MRNLGVDEDCNRFFAQAIDAHCTVNDIGANWENLAYAANQIVALPNAGGCKQICFFNLSKCQQSVPKGLVGFASNSCSLEDSANARLDG